MKTIDLTLPEWAFLDGNNPSGDTLKGRTVITHIRSASIIEALHEDFVLKDNIVSYKFVYTNRRQLQENITLVIHHCCTLDVSKDQSLIIEQILKPCAEWYINYLKWEDGNIYTSASSKLN